MNWLDLIIVTSIGISIIKGLFDGIIKQVISLLSLIIAIFFAGKGASIIRDFIYSYSIGNEKIPDYILTVICYAFAFSIIVFVFHFLGKLIESTIKKTPISSINYLLGGLVGALKITIFLSLIFTLLIIFDPNSHIISKQSKKESVLFNRVRVITPFLYPYVREYLKGQDFSPGKEKNPLEQKEKSKKDEDEVFV